MLTQNPLHCVLSSFFFLNTLLVHLVSPQLDGMLLFTNADFPVSDTRRLLFTTSLR